MCRQARPVMVRMTGSPPCFFFYGTLTRGSANDIARSAHRLLRPRGAALIRGALWALPDPRGWYPALVAGEGWVSGELAVQVRFSPRDLAMLDEYEDFRPSDRLGSAYWRETALARDAFGRRRVVQVYRYVARLPKGGVPIANGDFAAWLRETGEAPYCAGD